MTNLLLFSVLGGYTIVFAMRHSDGIDKNSRDYN